MGLSHQFGRNGLSVDEERPNRGVPTFTQWRQRRGNARAEGRVEIREYLRERTILSTAIRRLHVKCQRKAIKKSFHFQQEQHNDRRL